MDPSMDPHHPVTEGMLTIGWKKIAGAGGAALAIGKGLVNLASSANDLKEIKSVLVNVVPRSEIDARLLEITHVQNSNREAILKIVDDRTNRLDEGQKDLVSKMDRHQEIMLKAILDLKR